MAVEDRAVVAPTQTAPARRKSDDASTRSSFTSVASSKTTYSGESDVLFLSSSQRSCVHQAALAPADDLRAQFEDIANFPEATDTVCSHEQFCAFVEALKEEIGLSIRDIENWKMYRQANTRLEGGSSHQKKAQYGRMTDAVVPALLKILQLNPQQDLFVDIGHGLGTAVPQAAYTERCRSLGIEVDKRRFELSTYIRNLIGEMKHRKEKVESIDYKANCSFPHIWVLKHLSCITLPFQVGRIALAHGAFELLLRFYLSLRPQSREPWL